MQEKHEVIKERLRFVRERMKAENVTECFVPAIPVRQKAAYIGKEQK